MSITTLTMSGANTDPGSTGNLSCNLITTTGGTIAIDTTGPNPLDTRCAIFAANSTSGGDYMRDTWTASTGGAVSFWLKINTLPSAETEFGDFMNSGAAQLELRLTAAGKFKVSTSAGVTLWTGTATASTATWYLFRTWGAQDSSVGQFRFDWSSYSGGLFTVVETSGLITGVNTGSSNYTGFQVGMKRTGTMTGNISVGGTRWNDPAATDLIPYHSRVGSGTAPITIGASGVGLKKQTGSGTAGITIGASGAGLKRGVGSGTAAVTVGASGSGQHNGSGAGTAPITIGASGSGLKRGTGVGTAPITIGASGAGQHKGVGSGTAGITIGAGGSGSGGSAASGFGTAPITIGASGTGYSIRYGSGLAPIIIGASGVGSKRTAGAGTAPVTIGGGGDGVHQGSGDGLAPILVGAGGTGTHQGPARNLTVHVPAATTRPSRLVPPTTRRHRITDPTE